MVDNPRIKKRHTQITRIQIFFLYSISKNNGEYFRMNVTGGESGILTTYWTDGFIILIDITVRYVEEQSKQTNLLELEFLLTTFPNSQADSFFKPFTHAQFVNAYGHILVESKRIPSTNILNTKRATNTSACILVGCKKKQDVERDQIIIFSNKSEMFSRLRSVGFSQSGYILAECINYSRMDNVYRTQEIKSIKKIIETNKK